MRPAPRLDLLFGPALMHKVASARVLMVGAGGIGCELLKNLVMSGFKHIEVVDLDTIDLSNLNRQFLFQKRHIKQSKAQVARESALQFQPTANIQAYHANIKDERFDVDWFRRFDIVTNALDNLDARRHVNRMCLAANVPLIESGTAGYLGQATVIKHGSTECFECQPKPTPTTFPICTIRSTPTAPIHCTVWAKNYLFAQLFDRPDDDDTIITSDEASQENAAELESLRKEAEALARIRDAAGTNDYAQIVFNKVFSEDIARLASVEEMWTSRPAPVPLDFTTLEQAAANVDEAKLFNRGPQEEQRVWTPEECLRVFVASAQRLGERIATLRRNDADAAISFDKDDDDALDFVTSAANLRAHIFGIEKKSRFDIKAMAGSIIPSIATTNAIISGVIVMQAMHVLQSRLEDCKTIYLAHGGRRDRLFYAEKLALPNPACYVCRNVYVTVPTDPERATLGDLINDILAPTIEQGGLGLGSDVSIMESGRMLYDPDWTDNMDRQLSSLGLTNGKMLTIVPEDDMILGAGRAVIMIIAQRPEMKTAERPVRLDGLPPASLLKPQNLPLVERLESSDAISQKRKPEEIDAGPSKSKHIIIDDDDVVMLDAPNQSSRIETEIRVAASSKQDDQADTNASEDTVPTPATNTKSLNALRRSLNGVFAVYKPSGMTSYDVVSSIKRSVFGLEEKEKLKGKSKRRYKPPYKIGHGGTLDPLADGVLVIGVGDGTKKMQDYLTGPKIYIGEGLLGAMTDTEDSTGKAIEFQPYAHVTQEALESVLDQFRGTIKQVPPLYSALKVDGRRMYEYAYSGEKLPRDIAARDVTIYTLRLELFTTDHNYQLPPLAEAATSADNTTTVETSANTTESPDAPRPPMFRLYVECGGGTYIRCLIRDIGRAVGSAAHMVKLTRVQQGSFHLEKNVIRLEDCTLDRVKALLTPTETS